MQLALRRAAAIHELTDVEYLLNIDVDPNAKDLHTGFAALHMVAINANKLSSEATEELEQYQRCVELLINHNADPNLAEDKNAKKSALQYDEKKLLSFEKNLQLKNM